MSNDGSQRDVTEPRFRPDATWVCGHSDLGFTCSHGPTANGKCGSHQKDCSHEKSAENSACFSCELACHKRGAEGAQSPWRECEAMASSPCIPTRGTWSFRSTLALNLAVATAGILLCLMSFPQREATFVPGGLSSKHAQILENRVVSQRCSLCHPNSHTLSTTTGAIATQDELCTRCHEGHLPNLHLRSPHDIDREALKQLTLNALRSRGLLVSTNSASSESHRFSPSDRSSESASHLTALLASSTMETACASCHVEHHGRNHDLQAITDARCQACHAKQFQTFVNGHPEFDNYPVAQPRRIAFTHQAHLEKHFAKKNETFECSKCHVDSTQRGGVGSVFRTLGFDTACARCHNEPINAATADGWVLLQLPSIQPADTKQAALGLSDWPATAQFGYEGKVPLVMRSLLLADDNTEKALGSLPESGDIKSIANFAQVGRGATTSIAAGTRQLISDIATGGHVAWRKRLERVLTKSLARELTPREVRLVDDLCAGLPPDIFRQMQQNWFGEGRHGIASRDTDNPAGNQLKTQLISTQDGDLLLGSSNESADELLGRPQPKPQKSPHGPFPQTNSSTSDADLLLGNAVEPKAPKGPQKLTKLRGAIHVVEGGWYLDNETLSLRYMPRGHNDPTLAAWTEFATLLTDANTVGEGSGHAELATQVPGGCIQCHVLNTLHTNSKSDDSLWMATSKSATARSITKFDHTPHLTLPTLSDCKYCHQLDSSSGIKSNFTFTSKLDPVTSDGSQLPTCEFKSMHLEQCSACHRPNAASTGCTQCHNYHVTDLH